MLKRPPGRPPARHDLAWLVPGWRAGLRAPLDPATAAEVARWLDGGLPAVVRRRGPGEDGIALGVALPPGGAGRRAALRVAPGTLAHLAPPLLLAEAIPSAPAGWRPALADLEAEARRSGLALHLYGSLSWQHLTGLPYLHAGSDVDLLVRPGDPAALGRALALLAAREGQRPRLDGEVVVGGAAVAWRELWAAPARLLVKEEDGASLVPRAALLARLEREVAR